MPHLHTKIVHFRFERKVLSNESDTRDSRIVLWIADCGILTLSVDCAYFESDTKSVGRANVTNHVVEKGEQNWGLFLHSPTLNLTSRIVSRSSSDHQNLCPKVCLWHHFMHLTILLACAWNNSPHGVLIKGTHICCEREVVKQSFTDSWMSPTWFSMMHAMMIQKVFIQVNTNQLCCKSHVPFELLENEHCKLLVEAKLKVHQQKCWSKDLWITHHRHQIAVAFCAAETWCPWPSPALAKQKKKFFHCSDLRTIDCCHGSNVSCIDTLTPHLVRFGLKTLQVFLTFARAVLSRVH